MNQKPDQPTGEVIEDMFEPGTKVIMTKGYKGTEGIILEKTESRFDLYVLELKNGVHIVAGPSAFVPV